MIPKIQIRGNCRLEKDFQSQITKAYSDQWCFAYKIPDNAYSTKPYDMFIVGLEWLTYHIELKVIDKYSINFNDLRPNQKASLRKISDLDKESALVMIYSKAVNDYIIYTFLDFEALQNKEWTIKLFDKI